MDELGMRKEACGMLLEVDGVATQSGNCWRKIICSGNDRQINLTVYARGTFPSGTDEDVAVALFASSSHATSKAKRKCVLFKNRIASTRNLVKNSLLYIR